MLLGLVLLNMTSSKESPTTCLLKNVARAPIPTYQMTQIERFQPTARMSKVVRAGGLLFLGGQTANRSPSAHGDISAQTIEVLARVDNLLKEVGTDRTALVSATIYLRDMQDFDGMNAVWDAWLPAGCAPVRTTVKAGMSADNLLVEITVVAGATNP